MFKTICYICMSIKTRIRMPPFEHFMLQGEKSKWAIKKIIK